jgi:hypothetical protein
MITNQDLLIEHLAKWLAEYAKAAGRSVFVVGFDGARSDALLLHICSKATENYGGLATHALSFPTSTIEIKNVFNGNVTYSIDSIKNPGYYYLQCHEIAHDHGIVVGPVDRTFGLYYRSYGKRAAGSADVFPLFDLEYSEIVEITDSLWPGLWPVESTDIVADIEFCNEAGAMFGIITCEESPHRHPRWPYFIHTQKAMIAKVHQREKLTRHKKMNKPYPSLSDKPQLYRRVR